MLSGFSNFSRFVRDRIGRTKSEFEENTNSLKMKILNEMLMTGIDPVSSEEKVKRILKGLTESTGSDGRALLEVVIDWLSERTYQEQREFEELILNSAVLLSFLGEAPEKLNYEISANLGNRYRDNNLESLMVAASYLVPKLVGFVGSWPTKLDAMKLVRLVNRPLRFLSEDIMANKNLDSSDSYMLLNESFIFFKKMMTEKTEFSFSGAYYVAMYLSRPNVPSDVMNSLESLISYIEFIETKNRAGKSGIITLAENLSEVVNDKRFSLVNIKKYILSTTAVRSCASGAEVNCEANVHYDEPSQLLIFAAQKNGSNSSNIARFMDTLFKDHINDYTDLVDHLLPLIRNQVE